MSAKFFLDTNIFVYSFDRSSKKKAKRAQKLIQSSIESGQGLISYQVVQEFLNVALRKFASPFSIAEARDYYLKILKPQCTVHSSPLLTLRALSIQEETGFQWYDSLIVAAALQEGCSTLYSEDLQDGRQIEELTICNPFST